MAVAEASFKTVKVSMSLGFKLANGFEMPDGPELSIGNPSITIRGSLLADNEDPPRIRIVEFAPGAPLFDVTETPANFPTTKSCGDVRTPWLKSLLPRLTTAPVASFF